MDDKPDELTPDNVSDSSGYRTGGESKSTIEDGRSKEWQDRARVNLEEVADGTKTILERDFEPEQSNEGKPPDEDKSPAY